MSIIIKDLVKSYADINAVDSLSLEIEGGVLFALLGVNGAGKTTTIKMLSGLTAKTSGSVTINGFDLDTQKQNIKRITNISPQETAIASNLNVYQNIKFIADIYGIKAPLREEMIEKMITQFNLEKYRFKRAELLSGGIKRRLSIAMALVTQPEILYLDEPTLGLDVLARNELWKIISNLKGKMTIILTTHYMEEAEHLADKIGIMNNGKLVALGTSDELIRQANAKTFEEAFVNLAQGENI